MTVQLSEVQLLCIAHFVPASVQPQCCCCYSRVCNSRAAAAAQAQEEFDARRDLEVALERERAAATMLKETKVRMALRQLDAG
jgi:hypothetical protein